MTEPSVLDKMSAGISAAGIAQKKQGKAATLTPVASEPGGPLDGLKTKAPFPNDHPAEAIRAALAQLRLEAGHILEAVDAAEAALRAPDAPAPVVEEPVDVKALEQSADAEAFKRDFAAKQAAAQAAAFAAADTPAETPEPATGEGWACPVHGLDSVVTLKSRKGREYRACSKCEEFEKL